MIELKARVTRGEKYKPTDPQTKPTNQPPKTRVTRGEGINRTEKKGDVVKTNASLRGKV